MISNKDITVIVPVHKWNGDIKAMLENALQSVPKACGVIISTPKTLKIDNPVRDIATYTLVNDIKENSFQALVNNGVKNVTTDWFSILEFDDEYSPKWFDNFAKYQEYNQQYNIFLPINDLYNAEKREETGQDEFVGNGNEVAWASSFSDELGVIDEKCVTDFFDFYFTGGIFNKQMWNTVGGLKENIKLTFWYEWILRAEHNGEKAYVVPKVGYAHTLARKDSLMMSYRETINAQESDFWYRTAKKEAYYKEMRNVEYVD